MMKPSKLQAPKEYFELNKEEKQKIVNQCGPNGPLSKIIPNSLLGRDISVSCNIHDVMVHLAKSSEELDFADKTFLENMYRQVNEEKSILNPIRRFFSFLYYQAVRVYSMIKLISQSEL